MGRAAGHALSAQGSISKWQLCGALQLCSNGTAWINKGLAALWAAYKRQEKDWSQQASHAFQGGSNCDKFFSLCKKQADCKSTHWQSMAPDCLWQQQTEAIDFSSIFDELQLQGVCKHKHACGRSQHLPCGLQCRHVSQAAVCDAKASAPATFLSYHLRHSRSWDSSCPCTLMSSDVPESQCPRKHVACSQCCGLLTA